MIRKDLPPFYYLTHFSEFIDFIKNENQHLLLQQHSDFLNTFDNLSHSAKCLCVRLINRKFPIIKLSSLRFNELGPYTEIIPELYQQGLVRDINEEQAQLLLSVLNKVELLTLLSHYKREGMPHFTQSSSKPVLLDACKHLSDEEIVTCDVAKGYILQTYETLIDYFLFLYFGHLKGKLNQFSMRDLGIMRTREGQAQMTARFERSDTAYNAFLLAKQYESFKQAPPKSAHGLVELINTLPDALCQQALTIRNKLVFRCCKLLLPLDVDSAIQSLSLVNSAEAQELWCRENYKLGKITEVEDKLNEIINAPYNDKILQFAEDFLQRKYHKKKTSILTDMLREHSKELNLDEIHKGAVERGVMSHYHKRGAQTWRTENRLWNNLFGLVFWQELFELPGLGLATQFDYLPICLKQNNFLDVANTEITQKLDKHSEKDRLFRLVTGNAAKYYGQSQGIVHWHKQMLEPIKVLIEHADIRAIHQQILRMAENYELHHDGYPDIMLLDEGQLRFEEIKAEGDSLRKNQLIQIQGLNALGIKVDITKVNWVFDPMQSYVVVDIETTGGMKGKHKITEIGMVKVCGGKIIDSWQSLVNPQRNIPQMITRLTGIDNNMVASAPSFAELADEIESFSEDCIFVAHNVNFDYGFFRAEFSQLGRHYKRPKLCTVQQMRKYFPGLASYSLANLCKHFDISMERHHRAMSDAMAANELLTLINERRLNFCTSP